MSDDTQRPDERVEAIIRSLERRMGGVEDTKWGDHIGIQRSDLQTILAAYNAALARAERAEAATAILCRELLHRQDMSYFQVTQDILESDVGAIGMPLLDRLDRLQDIIEYIRTYDPVAVDAAEAQYPAIIAAGHDESEG